jgi:hypothetical protein
VIAGHGSFSGIRLVCCGGGSESRFAGEKNEIISFKFFFIKNNAFYRNCFANKKARHKKILCHVSYL